jgi:hypothetical protein
MWRKIERCVVITGALMSGLGCHEDEARVIATYFPRPNLPVETFHVTLDDGGSSRSFGGRDLTGTDGRVSTPMIGTRTGGTLRVSYNLEASGDVVSEGTVTLPLQRDWAWGLDVQVDSLNPTRYCLGCLGSKAFSLSSAYRRTAADSVWVTWGGNSISNPGIF